MPENTLGKSLLAILLGILLMAVILVSIEWAFRFWTGAEPAGRGFFPEKDAPDGLGWVSEASATIHQVRRNGDTVVFDVDYRIDQHHRRVIPFGHYPWTNRFALFFGASNTFGEGLRGEESIPALVQKAQPGYHVVNYGERGYGPQQMLSKLQAGSLHREVKERRGVVLFQYFQFLVWRAIGSFSTVYWAGGRHPYYYLDNSGVLRRNGSFADGRFFQTGLYWLLGRSTILHELNLNLPPKLDDSHFELTCRIVRESKKIIMDEFPKSRFVVVVGMISNKNDPFVNSCLDRWQIEYVDVRVPYSKRNRFLHAGDPHLNARGARVTANKIIEGVFSSSY